MKRIMDTLLAACLLVFIAPILGVREGWMNTGGWIAWGITATVGVAAGTATVYGLWRLAC